VPGTSGGAGNLSCRGNLPPELACSFPALAFYAARSYSFAYSALACRRMGMSGSASFQSVNKSR
jgi:hypothetical protein